MIACNIMLVTELLSHTLGARIPEVLGHVKLFMRQLASDVDICNVSCIEITFVGSVGSRSSRTWAPCFDHPRLADLCQHLLSLSLSLYLFHSLRVSMFFSPLTCMCVHSNPWPMVRMLQSTCLGLGKTLLCRVAYPRPTSGGRRSALCY